MAVKPMGVGVIGSGMISGIYLENMTRRFEILRVAGICSAHMDRAKARGDAYGVPARPLEEMLADPEIEMIVNLTPAPAHEGLIRRALEAGKHVYTEKTITTDHRTARALAALAKEKGLYLGAAPDTFLGAALQTARRAVDDGRIGEITSFAIATNRDNAFLTPFFTFLNLPGGGVGYDYGVYYLTALFSLLGPAARVAATVRAPYPTHEDINPKSATFGQTISTPNESQIAAVLTLKSGVAGTVSFNSDSVIRDQSYFALFGTKGILYLPDPNGFGGEVRLLPNWAYDAEEQAPRALENRFGYAENSRGVGPAEMAWSIRAGRPCRANAEMACHVLDVLDAIIESGKTSAFVDIESGFERPAPLNLPEGGEESSIR